jgi:hypothetical protein
VFSANCIRTSFSAACLVAPLVGQRNQGALAPEGRLETGNETAFEYFGIVVEGYGL